VTPTSVSLTEMAESSSDELRQRALQLPADERIALATELLDSVEGREDPEWSAAWAAELDRRVRDLEHGTAKTIPFEQVKAEIQARLRSR
jgi:putative addiction module component (TIGR02574 family)